ncbi:MAG: glucose 1-dehydrogenase [Anaerolineales bacterium]|jgi:NAD(P)-dependent dehydrogenase (short-subunit alcohol dehydrogenase family)|nr:glucose 1-dehydrogenase [Anaerolineales bacterium]HJN42176.1 glucose 1-dehydrogenase [Anaerolineales bacterium]|tara:strand:+ start:12374 stop:13117 length:744 start_codon:yes stop_codon:yes gene_type:complete
MRLSGKIAIITGAASGIGEATAKRFCEEGARVAVVDINDEGGNRVVAEIQAAGGDATFLHADVGVPEDLENMVDGTVAKYGGLDVLHNNAYWTDAKTAEETTAENWQRTIDVTLRPVYLATKMALPHLRVRGGGVILNTASLQSVVGFPSFAAYQAAKGGVMALTRAMALELAPDNIRVMSILPGAIDTPSVGLDDPSAIDAVIENIPLGRLGKPVEIANTAVFLVSDEAPYITGTGLLVDGGYTAQ